MRSDRYNIVPPVTMNEINYKYQNREIGNGMYKCHRQSIVTVMDECKCIENG